MPKKNNNIIGEIFIIGFVILFVFIFLYAIITKTSKTDVPIDCSGNWNVWSICDTYLGTKTRTFNMIKAPLNGGICPGPEIIKCPIDCSWNWNDWSDCNANTGRQNRTIKKIINTLQNDGTDCPRPETIKCCSGNWNNWSDCNENTGERNRTFTTPINPNCPRPETIKCDVDCSWNWNNWNICDTNTGTTSRTFNIKINPHNNGLDCPRPETIKCQIDCSWNWNNWSDWIDCATEGQITRTINIIHPLKFGGAICPGIETKDCPIISKILGADISGNITTDNYGDKFIIFKTGNCSFIVKSGGITCDILMIGGGGGGGYSGGGGGAGACIIAFTHKFSAGLYNVNVGAGGTCDKNGGDSSIYKDNNLLYLAKGGGSGATDKNDGNDGGCGGGAGRGYGSKRLGGKNVGTNIVPTTEGPYFVYGSKGGDQTDDTIDNSTFTCAGGGGIGGAGTSHTDWGKYEGQGGTGINITQLNLRIYNLKSYFANDNPFGHNDNGYIGGGGGGSTYNYPNQALGGKGGGGNGYCGGNEYTGIGKDPWIHTPATSGAPNTGSGGGGGGGIGNGGNYSSGGSGMVIIRYRERGDWD